MTATYIGWSHQSCSNASCCGAIVIGTKAYILVPDLLASFIDIILLFFFVVFIITFLFFVYHVRMSLFYRRFG